MKTYTDGEVTDGVTIMGLPIGSNKYCQSAFNNFVTKFEDNTTTLLETMSDPQTTLQLYTECLLQRAPFRTATDVM
eukprot:6376741-Ditylum_brightwellii.AAC.1